MGITNDTRKKKRLKTIFREAGENKGEPYLIRRYLFRCRWFQIVLHKILLSDYDCLHDHPWNFISIILRGGYFELTPKYPNSFAAFSELQLPEGMAVKKKWYGPLSILFRPAKWKHSLELPEGKTALSIVIMFKKKRQWGFWTKQGYRHHLEYNPSNSCE